MFSGRHYLEGIAVFIKRVCEVLPVRRLLEKKVLEASREKVTIAVLFGV